MLQLTYTILLSTHLVAAIFFHEHSAIELTGGKNTGFGFSLGYQKGIDAKLVIGEPRYNQEGRVRQCSIYDISRNHNKECNPVTINFDKLRVNRTLNPDQYFYLGASVAATQNGFVTCAPLRTTDARVDGEPKYDAFGVCFAYDDSSKTVKPWNLHSDFSDNLLEGGGGWSTLVDEKHDRIIISQFMTSMNSVYGNISNPENYTRLLSKGGYKDHKPIVDKVTIYGQAVIFGNYFNQDKKKIYYAFSMKTFRNTGAIDFFSCDDFKWTTRLEDHIVGSMFGAALGSADVTGDGRDELIVGAPAQVGDAISCDRGTLHVYTSVNSSEPQMELKLTVWGVKDHGRFGTALVTNDVDGDSYPEIIVSAPFEKPGGALYILCGYEIHKLMASKTRTVFVTDLNRMQRIQKSHSFGLTLLSIADFNDNGSDELGIGSPEESTVALYKGVRAIAMNITSEFKNDATASNTEFIFSSCITVKMPPKPKNIATRLLVKNVLFGEKAFFKRNINATYELDFLIDVRKNIDGDLVQYCRQFLIESPLSCKVNTTVSLMEDIKQERGFKNTWVTLSAQSQLTKVTQPTCKCNGTCSPDYTMDLQWSGVKGSHHKYVVGSSEQETISIVVRNHGTMGCDACAIVRLSGTVVHTLTCKGTGRRYVCDLPTPFRADTNNTIDIRLLTNTLSNQEKNLTVDVEMRKDCNKSETINSTLQVSLDFQKVLEKVIIDGSSIRRPITDAELQDKTDETLSVEQTFTILNNHTFKWSNVSVNIDAINRPYIQNLTIRMKQPMQSRREYHDAAFRHWRCSINLAQNSMTEVFVTTVISKKELAHFLQSGSTYITITELKLELLQDEIKAKKITTEVIYKRELTGQNHTALTIIIAFIVALVVLLLIAFILYKLNFFKRKNKQDLEELKKEIKDRNLWSVSSKASGDQLTTEAPAVCRGSDTVDLIVDETPFDNSLSPAQLNCLAANPEMEPKDVLAPKPEAPKSQMPPKSDVTPKAGVTPKSDVTTKSDVTPKSEVTPKSGMISNKENDGKEDHGHSG